MPVAISFILLHFGYHLVINRKIVGNELYEMDLSMIPYWIPFSLGTLCIIVGFMILYKGYMKN